MLSACTRSMISLRSARRKKSHAATSQALLAAMSFRTSPFVACADASDAMRVQQEVAAVHLETGSTRDPQQHHQHQRSSKQTLCKLTIAVLDSNAASLENAVSSPNLLPSAAPKTLQTSSLPTLSADCSTLPEHACWFHATRGPALVIRFFPTDATF